MKMRRLSPEVPGAAEKDDDHPLYSLQRKMNNLFDDFFSGLDMMHRALGSGGYGAFSPSVDVKESETDFVILAELPGVDEEAIEVILASDAVTIKGEKHEEKEDKGKNYRYMERSYGSFNRVIPLTAEIEASGVDASFKNGLLSIRIPKSAQAKASVTKIPVKAS